MDQPNLKLAVPFFIVANMERSLDFYTRGLGFTLTKQWTPRGKIEWCWLTRDLISIMLQEPRAKDHAIDTPDLKKGFGITISTQCEDALTLYHEFRSRNLPASEPFVGNNLWVFNITDPDGYRLVVSSPRR